MAQVIDTIPVRASVFDDPIKEEVDYWAWDMAHQLIFKGSVPVSDPIREFFSFGYYKAQVFNGGHSQLVFNMDRDSRRSPFLFKGCAEFARSQKIDGLPQIVADFESWLLENPYEASEQTGFQGGRADALDQLDDQFVAVDRGSADRITELYDTSKHTLEAAFLLQCLNRSAQWYGDLRAIEISWILRSGVVFPVPDEDFAAVSSAMLSGHKH